MGCDHDPHRHPERDNHVNRSRLAALSAGAMFLVASVIAPAVATADTGGTNTVKVLPATTTVPTPGSGSITVNIVANGSTAISGAGAALYFDHSKLTLTAVAKTSVPITDATNPLGYVGFPTSGQLAGFLSRANAGAGSLADPSVCTSLGLGAAGACGYLENISLSAAGGSNAFEPANT